MGDSITEGTGASRPWRGWPIQAAYRLGIDNPIIDAIGGGGYLAALKPGHQSSDADNTFRQRIDDVLKAVNGSPPDAVFVAGGINDNGFAPDAVGTEALLYFQQIRAAAPDAVLFVVTPFTNYDNPGGNPGLNAIRDQIIAAANKVSDTYVIDVTPLVTPANRDMVFNAAVDRTHPVDAGHALYAEFITDAAKRIIQAF